MRITNITSGSGAAPVRKKDEKREASAFSSLLGGEEEVTSSAPTGAPSALSSMSALLNMQMLPPETAERQHIRRGNNLLDYLDKLRVEMLEGSISLTSVQNMVREIRNAAGAEEYDPKLKAIITEIETRAEVELAKIELARLKTKNNLQNP